jgi:glucose/arabinose dehydrogenase
LGLEQLARGLRRPVALADAGDFSGRLYVAEKRGPIRIVENGSALPTPFLDISDRVASDQSENGLLGLAFHPDYPNNGFFYVYYSNLANQTVLARYSVSGNPNVADKNSETVLLTFDQPTPEHNGGQLTFGTDGYLYVGLGDGGGVGDEYNNGQNGGTLLGAILRLDVDSGLPYSVPPDNPFVGDPNIRDEIWTYGLRNPWGYALDRDSGEWYIADVGETKFEEINVQPAGVAGQNYGWPQMEGTHCYPSGEECEKPGMVSPVYEYTHTEGCAVVGGFVYRGRQFPALDGTYLFGDYCAGQIWALRKLPIGGWQFVEMSAPFVRISAFGQDRNGEVYVLDYKQGAVYLITASL